MDMPLPRGKRGELSRASLWSKLSPLVLRKILESLSPIDSHRAKTVCSDWFSVWKTCVNLPPCPLRIIHQGEDHVEDHGYGYVYGKGDDDGDVDEDDSDNGDEGFSKKAYCIASSGSWLMMVDCRLCFYLSNLLTLERINLPSMNSPIGVGFRDNRNLEGYFVSLFRGYYEWKDILELKNSALLWVNERTGDYAVSLIFRQHYLFTHKKGDESWSNLNLKTQNSNSVCVHMAYKDGKLYVLKTDNHITIFDLFEDLPKEVVTLNPYRYHPFRFDEKPSEYIWKRKIAVNKDGEVLIILSLKEVAEERLLFYIFKMNLETFKWERLTSIGDEMLIFGHGVTVRAPVKDFGDGIKSGSIYFVKDDVWPDHQEHDHRASDCGVFDIATSRIQWPKRVCHPLNRTQWFVPGVAYY